MPYWVYGVGFAAVILIVAALKADFNTRMILVAVAVAAIFLMRGRKRR